MEPSLLIAIAGSACVFLVGALFLTGGGNNSSKRVKAVSGGKQKNSLMEKLKVEDSGTRRKQIEEKIGKIEQDKKARKKRSKSLPARLVQADWDMKPQRFYIISFILAAIAAVVPIFFGLALPIGLGIGLVVGFGLPRFILNAAINRRQKKFVGNFADAMEIIVRGVRTGLPLGDCLKIIAHESPDPLGSEFRLMVQAESIGVPMEICLEQMYERMPISEVNFFATVLSIQKSTGGNLGESLANLANVLRGRKLLREKIKALSAEAKMSAMIIGALPIVVMLLVSIASPEYMTELYTTKTGHRNMMIGAGMMGLGTLMMRKMINFKF